MLCNRIASAIPRTVFARLALAALTLAVMGFAAALLMGESDIAHAQASDAITGDNITISTTALTVNEGTSVTYTVSLDKSPEYSHGTVIFGTEVRELANASITVSPGSHHFDYWNWQTPVTFTVTAHSDDNLINGSATIKHVAHIYGNDHSASTTVELPSVTVTETDVPRCPTTIINTDADFYRATGQRWDWEWDDNWSERQSCASQNHELQPARYYQFSIPQGKAARNVTITLVADDADPEIYLRSGNQRNGRQLAYNDDYQSNPNRSGNRWISRIRQNLGPGDYTIEAAYRLTANTQYLPAFSLTVDGLNDDVDASPECDVNAAPMSSPEPGAPPPLLNAQMNATWDGSCDSTFTALYGHSGTSNARWYKFDVKERGLYTIDLNSDSAHPWMHLRRGDSAKSGDYIARAEGKSGARIQRWLDPGWHTVEATNYHGGSTGPFTLNIKETRIRPGSAPSATGATLNLYGWDGSWYYRANTGPHTSCSGAQSGNSVTLTGLSEDATYTYTIYSDASCSNAIASTSFIATASAGVAQGVILTDASANTISSVSVPENGSASYRVRLSAAPSGGVTTVTITEGTTAPNNDADITVTSPSNKTLTFSTSNWWLPQTVTLSAGDDVDKTSGSRDIGHAANGGGYSNVTGSLTAVEIEDDAAIVLSETAVTVPENGSATYTVKLTTPPTADVTVTIATATTGNHTDDNIRVSSPSNGTLSFTSQNYDTAQTVTLRANSDSDAINGTRDITHTASGGNFDGAPVATVLATERDSQARVNVTQSSSAVSTVSVVEEATATYDVTLDAQPAADVAVTIAEATTGNDIDEHITVTSSKTLTFTPQNYATPQPVTLAAAEDHDLADGRRAITHTASDAGNTHSGYDGAPVKSVTAREDDIDTGGIAFADSAENATTTVSVNEEGTGSYKVKLTHKPTGTVNVQVRAATGGSNDTDITVQDTNDGASGNQTGSITFNADNWDTYRTVTLAARDDDDTDTGSRTIDHTANGGGYSNITGALTASEVENDATIVISKSAVSIPEGSTATYTVKLGTAPTANVTVNLFAITTWSESDITISSPSSEQLTFCPSSSNCTSPNTVWSTAQTVTLAAAEDTANFGGEVNGSQRIRHRATSADASYNNMVVFLTASEVENDKGILVPSFVDVPEGGSANFDVSLHVQPTHDVTVTISEATTGWAIDPDITVTSPASKTLTFTNSNWNIGQAVTLSAAQDDDFSGDSRNISISSASSDADYNNLSTTIFAIEAEDDVGLVLPATASVNEAGTGTYRVRLSAEPTGNVYVSVRAASGSGQDTDITIKDTDDSTDGDQTGSILFTADNWSTSRTVTLAARDDDDFLSGSRTIRHSASGGQYGGITGTMTAIEAENDYAVLLSKSAVSVPEDSTATYTVKLSARPSSNVTVTIAEGTTAPNNDMDITVTGPSSKSLTFCSNSWGCTSPNTVWSEAQTVTLTADEDNDSDNGSRDINHTAASTDSNYSGLTASLTASEVENDLAVVIRNDADTSDITSLNVNEGGSAKYKVKLATQPTASVTVKLTAATGDSDITFSPSSMTFSTSSWSNPKTVTVRARQDNTDVIPGTKTITHTANGGDYVNITSTLTATEVEDDTLTLVFNPTDDVQVNEGGTGTYTLKLSHKPAANAEISIVCCSHNNDDGDLGIKDTDDSQTGDQTSGPTFTPENWNIPRTITLDADEDNDVRNGQAEITHRINNTGPYYNITAHEVENDPGILIRNYADDSDLPSDGFLPFSDVPEGSTARYKVKLATRPAGTVTVTITEKTGGDSDITISSPSSKRLTFTTGNWNRGQTVTLRAAQDGGSAEGSRIIQHTASGSGYNIITPVELTAYEIDDEKAIIFCPGSGNCNNNTITSIKVTEGRWVDYRVKISQNPLDHRGGLWVTLTASGDRDIVFDTDIDTEGIQTNRIWLSSTWDVSDTIRLYAARDSDRSNGVTNIKHTASGGGYDKLPATLKATETDNVITLTADNAATSQNISIANWWSNWYVKRTSPSVGSCDGSIASDSAYRYDDLSAGTAYTYKAYSDSSCTQEIASKTFTTRRPSLNVSDVTHNSATLLLSNWDFDSGTPQSAYWGSSKSPGGTCYPSRDAYTVDLLSPNTSYTLTAYVDDACTTEIGRKTITTLAGASALHTVSNSSETQSSHFTVNLSDSYATSFTTGNATSGYTLGNITITMSGGVSDPSKFAAKIYNNSSGKPGSLKTTLVGEAPVNHVAYRYHCISSCGLSANTTYHLALEVSEDGSFVRWPRTASDDETVTSVSSGWSIGDATSKAISGVWTASADTKSGRFSVRAAPVSPYMLPSSVTGDSATLTMYGHTGNWYYKANKTPHTTCSTAQSGDTAASVTGLTAGTEYIYTAYRNSNCSTAIAKVRFTTSAGLTEVDVTATTVRLDLTGHSGAWWYDDTASAVSCTKVNSGTSPGRVKGMTKNTSYTFKAYSASGCASANELAATTFTTKNPALTSSNVTGRTAKLTLSNWATTNGQLGSSNSRDGYWYYKYTVPSSPAGACTAGPTSPDDSSAYLISSAELSGLSPGTAYTFKAYHDSSCTSSKEIATAASFTTDAELAVKDGTLTTTSATIVLAGNSAAWWLKKTAPTPAGSCESKQSSDTEVALTTLTLGTRYTYKAFSSSASCTSGTGEIASVSFYTTTLAASSITVSGATLTINGHSGSWWYKANQGPHSTCQSGGSTSNNTDSETLSGLSAATEYTYTAYSASGCAAANLVATETFTTSGVSVSNLGNNNSNTLLIGRQFGSQVDSIAVAFTTGSESNGYTLSSVTASFAGKSGSPGNIAAAIHSDSSGLPGSEVASLTLSGPTSPSNVDAVYTCSGAGCSLSKDTTYHLVFSTTTTGMLQHYRWNRSALTSETNSPSNAGWSIANSSSRKRGTNAWSSVSGNRPAKVKVVATVNAGGGGSGAPDAVASVTANRQGEAGAGGAIGSQQSGSIAASWAAANGATGYDVRYSADDMSTWTQAAANQSETSYTLTGASSSQAYVVGVRAVNSAGESAWTNSNAVPAAQQPPVDIGSPALTVSNSGSASWTYTVPEGAEYVYTEIRWLETAGREVNDWDGKRNKVFYDSSVSAHAIAGLTAGVEYKAKVFVGLKVNGENRYAKSNTVVFTPPVTKPPVVQPPVAKPPSAVSSVSASRLNGDIVANWEAVSGATKYHVTYSTNNGASWSLAALEHTKKTITIANADNSKSYIVGVRAGNADGWSAWTNSNVVPADGASITLPPVVQPPSAVSSVSAGRWNGGIVANWEAVSGATKYHVTYSADGGASWSLAASEHTKKTITIDNADDSKSYIVGVRAGNAGGWSGWKNSNTVPAAGQ